MSRSRRSVLRRLLAVSAFSGILAGGSSAQVLVTATAGDVGPTMYPSLKSAFDAVNAGTPQGVVTMSVLGDTTETAPAVLIRSGTGNASYTSIVLAPQGVRTIAGNLAGAPLVDLDGASNVTIDGRLTGGNALTISNLGSGASSTIRFLDGATGNTVTRCTLLGAGTSTLSGTVFFSTSGAAAGNSGNTIASCNLGPAGAGFATNGILSSGTSGLENSGNVIASCDVADSFNTSAVSAGILVSAASTGWTLTGNRVYQTSTRTYTIGNTHRGIQIGAGSGHTVSGNVIGFSSAAGTGTTNMTGATTRFIGIDLAVGTAAPTSVQGNTVAGISLATMSAAPTANGALCGINVTSGDVNVGTLAPNTIGSASGTGSLAALTTANGGAVVGINTSSSGTVVLQGNVLGALLATGSDPLVGVGVVGISVSGAPASVTISGNVIGNAVADNMMAGTSGTTTGSSRASGIVLTSTPSATTITANTIRNLASYGTGATGYVRGIWTSPGVGAAATFTISGNTVANLVTDSTNTGIANGQVAAVGISVGLGTGNIVSGNTISGVARTNTGPSGGYAAGITSANATSTTIAGNRIWDIRNASTSTSNTGPGIAAGVVIRSGNTDVTVVDNMISLGTGQTTNTAFIGIMANHGSTPEPTDRIYFNTIHVAGTAASGAQPTFGFARTDFTGTARTAPIDFRNNLVTNVRTGGTGPHLAIANGYGAAPSTTGWGPGASNYNVLDAAAGTVGWWGSALTIAGWQTASAGDARSSSGIPVSYADPAGDLHLAMGTTPTPIESGGIPIAGFTTDFDLEVRPGPPGSVNGGASAPDIGADEFDGVPLDAFPPILSYTPLRNTSLTTDRSVAVTIADPSGTPTSGPDQPRILLRKNGGAWSSAACALASGTGTNGTWDCPIDVSLVGGVAFGDTIDYFAVAQDLAPTPNLGSFPHGAVGSGVNAVTTPPATPSRYVVVAAFPASLDVGAAEGITSLTNPGGLFDVLNAGILTGDLVVNITSDLAGETGAVALYELVEEGTAAGTSHVTIRPSGGAFTVSGSSVAASPRALVRVNGTHRLTIDGSASGGADRSLTIANADPGTSSAVILLSSGVSGAQDDTLVNLVVVGSGSAATLYGIALGGATVGSPGADNDRDRVESCEVRNVQYGIVSLGQSAANKNAGTVITRNVLGEGIGRGAILVGFEDGVQITRNTIDGIESAGGGDVFGISLGGVTSFSSGAISGSEATNAVVTANTIGVVRQTNTFSAAGILVGPATSGTTLIANNLISGVLANGTLPDLGAGIYVSDTGTDSLTLVRDNSVSMSGTLTGGTQPQYALAIGGDDPAVDVRGNILFNDQVTGSGRSYAVGLGYSTFANLTSDFNDLFVPAGGTFAVGRTGNLSSGGIDRPSLASWQVATGTDASSLSVDPLFRSTTDLHLRGASPVLGAGTPLALAEDVDLDPRPASNPDIGADEVVQAVAGAIPAGTYYNAASSSSATDTLGGPVAITNEMTLNGVLSTGPATLTLGCGAAMTGAGAARYVAGNLIKTWCAPGTKELELGTANGYSPVTMNVTAGGFPADVTATALQGVLPNMVPVDQAITRSWTLAGTGLTADVTFHYLAGDVPASVTESNLRVWRREMPGNAFTSFPTSLDTGNHTGTAAGVTSFSDWTLATVAARPPSAAVSGDATICVGTSATISAALTGTGPWSLTWSDGATQNGVVASPATRLVSPASSTSYTVTSVSDLHGAGTSSGSASVTVTGAIPAAGNDGPACAGATLHLTASTVAGATYVWNGPNGFSSSAQNPVLSGVTAAAGGTYGVTATVGSCTSPAATTSVVVNPDDAPPAVTAPAPVTGLQTLCCGTFGGASGATSPAIAAFLSAGSATDDCDPSPVRLAPQAGGDVTGDTCFQAGTTAVTFRYRDTSGKIGTASAGVTVRMFADLNLDALADPSDMVILRAYFNFAIFPGTSPFNAPLSSADLNHDGVVDPTDLVMLRAFFNFAVSCLAP